MLLSLKLVWMSRLISNLFKQEPEVLGQVGVEAYMTLAIVASCFGNKSYLGPKHQNDKLCRYYLTVLMTDSNNYAMLRETSQGD